MSTTIYQNDVDKEEPGGIIVCGQCGTLYEYNDLMELAVIPFDEFNQLLFDNPEAHMIISKLFILIKERITCN